MGPSYPEPAERDLLITLRVSLMEATSASKVRHHWAKYPLWFESLAALLPCSDRP